MVNETAITIKAQLPGKPGHPGQVQKSPSLFFRIGGYAFAIKFRKIYQDEIKPTKRLIPFLQALKTKQIPTAVGTSAPLDNLDFVLDALNFRQYFDALLHSKDVTQGKPHPEIYLKAAAALKVAPERCIVIKDSLPGLQAGLQAGMKVVGVTTIHTPEELHQTHLVIQDFEELSLEKLSKLLNEY